MSQSSHSNDSSTHQIELVLPKRERSVFSLSTRELGRYGEELAALYLEQEGYEIVDRNVTVQRGEIDIWAKKDETLVFVEVKTRRGKISGTALESVDVKKREQMLRVIACSAMFMAIDMDMRVDVVGVQMLSAKKYVLTHVQNVDLFS